MMSPTKTTNYSRTTYQVRHREVRPHSQEHLYEQPVASEGIHERGDSNSPPGAPFPDERDLLVEAHEPIVQKERYSYTLAQVN